MHPKKTDREHKRILSADNTLVLGARHNAHNVGLGPISERIVIQGCSKDNREALGHVLVTWSHVT